MAKRVFISYRRADTEAIAGRLSDNLRNRLPKNHVFFDVGSIEGGALFRERIVNAASTFDTMIVMIGAAWLGPVIDGRARIWHDDDYVRLETKTALNRGDQMTILPVLCEGADVPAADELPEELRGLLMHNMMKLSHATFERDFPSLFAGSQGKTLAGGRPNLLRIATATCIGAALGSIGLLVLAILHKAVLGRALSESLGGGAGVELLALVVVALGTSAGFVYGYRQRRDF